MSNAIGTWPASVSTVCSTCRPHQRYVLYPVRCIRRKNVGEAVLWSLVSADDTVFGLTLPPENPQLAPAYAEWKKLALTLGLPCRFEVGREGGLRYPDNIAAADTILTTSLVEGFGMVYLETWLSGHPLAGRELPEITEDFVRSGLVFDHLQPKLPVPMDLVGQRDYESVLQTGYDRVLEEFGVVPNTDHVRLTRRIEQRLAEGVADFGELDEDLQQRVVTKLAQNPVCREQFQVLNSWMSDALVEQDDSTAVRVQGKRGLCWTTLRLDRSRPTAPADLSRHRLLGAR